MKTLNQNKPLSRYFRDWQVLEFTLMEDKDLQRELGIHRNTTLSWRTKGILPYLKINGRIHYRIKDVLVFLNQHPEYVEKLERKKVKK